MPDQEKIVLIGAGSAVFTQGLIADLIDRGWSAELALVDVNGQALEVSQRLARKMVQASGAPVRVSADTDRRKVLPGASAVICTIGVGGRRAWEQDVFVPRKHGIYQPVGDSVMPGGASRSLRMIPAMVEIARDVLDLAPEALFFSYSNPMSTICRAVRKATGANMVGLCHGVNHTAAFIAGALGVDPSRLRYAAAGVNHLTWFTELRVDGLDVMDKLVAVARQQLESRGKAASDGGKNLPFTWELTRLFRAFPAVLDRHVTEYFPHLFSGEKSYYGKTLGVDAFSFEHTIAIGDEQYASMTRDAMSDSGLDKAYLERMGGEHEQVLDIIASIRGDLGNVFSANLPNQGQIPNLPLGGIVEAPALATAAGMRAIAQPPLPAGLAGTLVKHMAWVELVVEAALEGRRDLFVQALLIDGAVASVAQAEALADDMLAAQAQYLPQFKTAAR